MFWGCSSLPVTAVKMKVYTVRIPYKKTKDVVIFPWWWVTISILGVREKHP